jgi:hypothetical protein
MSSSTLLNVMQYFDVTREEMEVFGFHWPPHDGFESGIAE